MDTLLLVLIVLVVLVAIGVAAQVASRSRSRREAEQRRKAQEHRREAEIRSATADRREAEATEQAARARRQEAQTREQAAKDRAAAEGHRATAERIDPGGRHTRDEQTNATPTPPRGNVAVPARHERDERDRPQDVHERSTHDWNAPDPSVYDQDTRDATTAGESVTGDVHDHDRETMAGAHDRSVRDATPAATDTAAAGHTAHRSPPRHAGSNGVIAKPDSGKHSVDDARHDDARYDDARYDDSMHDDATTSDAAIPAQRTGAGHDPEDSRRRPARSLTDRLLGRNG